MEWNFFIQERSIFAKKNLYGENKIVQLAGVRAFLNFEFNS